MARHGGLLAESDSAVNGICPGRTCVSRKLTQKARRKMSLSRRMIFYSAQRAWRIVHRIGYEMRDCLLACTRRWWWRWWPSIIRSREHRMALIICSLFQNRNEWAGRRLSSSGNITPDALSQTAEICQPLFSSACVWRRRKKKCWNDKIIFFSSFACYWIGMWEELRFVFLLGNDLQ